MMAHAPFLSAAGGCQLESSRTLKAQHCVPLASLSPQLMRDQRGDALHATINATQPSQPEYLQEKPGRTEPTQPPK